MKHFLASALTALLAVDLPLTATRVAGGSANRVELRNTGTQPINAWVFAVSTPNPSGGIHRVIHSADVYLSEVTEALNGAEPHLRPLQPGEARAVPVDPLAAEASIQVLAAVFDNNTAAGDEQTIDSIFQQRRADRDEFKAVLETFNTVLVGTHGVAALPPLQQRFAADAGTSESTPHRAARESVTAMLQRGPGATDEAVDQSLRSYVTFVTRQYEIAAKRAVRNFSNP
jgi:hypothetical protein